MSAPLHVLFVISPGLAHVISHHEATSGMGALHVPGTPQYPVDSQPFLYPPHTVATCVAALRTGGLDSTVLDAVGTREPVSALMARICHTVCTDASHLADVAGRKARRSVIAVLVSQGTAHADANFLRSLRHVLRPKASRNDAWPRILLFGPSAQFAVKPWLAEGLADAALLGEPEEAILEAVSRLADGNLQGAIQAATLRPDRYDAAGLLVDLDALPFPAWEVVPWGSYGAVSILSSRGCPASCAYCGYTVLQGHRFRAQSPERTVAELDWLAATVGPPRIQVRDPVFARDRARVVAICEGVLKRGLKINFACESRPEHFDDELLRLLAAAGCTAVKIGLESGDPLLLRAIGRVADAQAAEGAIAASQRVAATCRDRGIGCQVFVMAGLPGQDAVSLARTIEALRRLPPQTRVRAKPYQYHPGTALGEAPAPIPVDLLAELEAANQPRPGLFRRGWRALQSHLETRARRSGQMPAVRLPSVQGPHGLHLRPAQVGPAHEYPEIDLSGQRIFLTGGNGFLGGYVARALSTTGARIVALVRSMGRLGMLADLPVEIVVGDLRDSTKWDDALRGCALCFHVAAHYGGSAEANTMYATNVDGTSQLMAACAAAGVRRVVHTSTIGTVGRPADPTDLPDEAIPFNLWDQASHYVRSKYLGEEVALSWAELGLQVIVVKPTAPVGPGDRRPTATGRRIQAVLQGEPFAYPPAGINHVPVQDAAWGHLLAAMRGVSGQAYILGHLQGNLDEAAFTRLVAEVAGIAPPRPVSRHDLKGHLPAALTASPIRAVRELGLPQSDLRAAFAASVNWYLKQGLHAVPPVPQRV